MQEVKEIRFICANDEVCYGPEKGQNNITPEMQKRWKRVFKKIQEILQSNGISAEGTTFKQDDLELIVTLANPFSFEKALELLKQIEVLYQVTLFKIDTTYDDWDETDPHIAYRFLEI